MAWLSVAAQSISGDIQGEDYEPIPIGVTSADSLNTDSAEKRERTRTA
nr:MAG TPA: hypothetical protein [Caudoviricetes sp.]